MTDLPPKPTPRAPRVSLWAYMRLFRRDILSAQPQRLYRAWMAEFRTLFFRSYMINDPALIARVLTEAPDLFPKSNRIREGLAPLLGNSVFVTNGYEWKRQRRIIDPAFEGGRLRDTFPAMLAAGQAAVARMSAGAAQSEVEIEAVTSHLAADVIFRTLFSIPIEDATAWAVFSEFKAYQRSQPLLNLAAFIPLPKWLPNSIRRAHRRETLTSAQKIRALMPQILDVLARARHPVAITTKGALIARDAGVLGELAAQNLCRVGISITTLDAALSRKLEPRAPAPAQRLATIAALAAVGVQVRVMVAPVIPALTDHELEAILTAARDAGAIAATYIPLRLPREVSPLFQNWLARCAGGQASKVMARVREMQGGRDYDPEFGKRMRGTGLWADLLAQRFTAARTRLNLAHRLPDFDCSQFQPPIGQMSLL